MVRGRLPIVCLAALAGCTLITGVGELDPSLAPDIGPPDSSTPGVDGTTTGDGGATDGTTTDASQPDTSTRIKDITFENGAIIHAVTGGDSVTNDAGLALLTRDANVDEAGDATSPVAIGGNFSLQANGSAFLEESFGAIDEVYVTARVRIDAAPANGVTILRIVPETGAATIDVRLQQTLRLAVILDGQIGAFSPPLVVGKVSRIGIFVRKGKNSNGRLEVSLANDGTAFESPFAQSTNIDFERPEKLQIGLPNPATAITFDDVKIDSSALAPP